MATLRVVLDTNVLVSGIAYPPSVPGKILAAWRHGSADVLPSAYILDELRRVLPRLAYRHGLSSTEIDDLVDALSIQAEVIEPQPGLEPDLRDFDDQRVSGTLLAALKTSGANYLTRVTRTCLRWLNATRSSLQRRSGPLMRDFDHCNAKAGRR